MKLLAFLNGLLSRLKRKQVRQQHKLRLSKAYNLPLNRRVKGRDRLIACQRPNK